ncbi:hypothetical protein [Labilithrix luteola]|nr:hypothetical protein [Labilithrix luteola]
MLRRVVSANPVSFGLYRGRPVEFFREVLGLEPSEQQIKVLEATTRKRSNGGCRVSVPSGRATGKSVLDVGLALHFAATEGPNALVIFTAPTFKQIQRILWRELRQILARAPVPVCMNVAKLASTGAEFFDGSLIIGLVGDSPEAFQGLRAPKMRVIGDESSGIEDDTFVALEGNLAGGGDLILTGNPTRDEGYFFDSFSGKLDFDVIRLSSMQSPNVVHGKSIVPGMATREWIEARKKQWGEDSPMFKIHVLGEAANLASSRLYSKGLVDAAVARWAKAKAAGRIVIGVDPAGETGMGDESSFAPRRGDKVLWIRRRRGLSADGHVVEVNGMIQEIRNHRSNVGDSSVRRKALVVVDRDGDVGAKVYNALVAEAEKPDALFEVIGVRGSERARSADIDKVRDDLAISLVARLRTLGIPNEPKLLEELARIRVIEIENGRAKIVGKKTLRKELDRSPDSFDSLTLCAYHDDDAEGVGGEDVGATDDVEELDMWDAAQAMDPYQGVA